MECKCNHNGKPSEMKYVMGLYKSMISIKNPDASEAAEIVGGDPWEVASDCTTTVSWLCVGL